MIAIPWTTEDFEIICNHPHNEHGCYILDSMLMDDSRESALVYDLVVGHLLDEQYKYELEQATQEWWQSQLVLDELEANESWDDGYTF